MIFNLFKSKPSLKELIPDGFVDIHSHILPGIDDGAKDIEESILLIEKMKDLGFSKIIATPHTYPGLYDNTNDSIVNSFEKINHEIDNDLNISYASEYIIDHYLIKKAEERSLLCIKDNLVLVEMSFISAPNELYEIIFQLRLNNYTPILAHPERYGYLFDDFGKFKKLENAGCYFQLNLLSTTGYYGKDILNFADKLLEKNLINFVGSDIHSIRHIDCFNNKIKIKQIDKLEEIMYLNESLR